MGIQCGNMPCFLRKRNQGKNLRRVNAGYVSLMPVGADSVLMQSGFWGLVFSKRLPLQAGVIWLQQRLWGLADKENGDTPSGLGNVRKAVKPSED